MKLINSHSLAKLIQSQAQQLTRPSTSGRSERSEVLTTLTFWFSFQTWALAWGVLLQVSLQTCLLTLFQRLCFRQSLSFCGMLRKPFPYASRSSPAPPSPRQSQRPATTRSALHQFSMSPSLTLEPLLLLDTRCQSR